MWNLNELLSDAEVKAFLEKLGFVESSIGGEKVFLANLSVSIRVNANQRYASKVQIMREVYKRVAYHRGEFLKELDAIMQACLLENEAFDPAYTKQDVEKRPRLGKEPGPLQLVANKG